MGPMITPPTPPSAVPVFQWILGGRRSRLGLVQRLSLSFELRRGPNERHAELWVYGERRVRRWRVPTNSRGDLLAGGRLAPELEPLELWAPCPGAPPRWDQGRCGVDAAAFDRPRDSLGAGDLSLELRGTRTLGGFRLARTPFSVDGRRQWRIRRDDGVLLPEERH